MRIDRATGAGDGLPSAVGCALGDGVSGSGVALGPSVGVAVGDGVGVGGAPPLTCKITLSPVPSGCPGSGSCAIMMPRGFAPFAMGNHNGGPSDTPACFAAVCENASDRPTKLGT